MSKKRKRQDGKTPPPQPVETDINDPFRLHCEAEFNRSEGQAIAIGSELDKLVLALSGGALVLSVTLISDVFKDIIIWALIPLIVAWVALATALGLLLYALVASQNAFEFGQDQAINKYEGKEAQDNPHNTQVLWRRKWALRSCVLGITCLALFALINALSNYTHNHDEIEPEPTQSLTAAPPDSAAKAETDQGIIGTTIDEQAGERQFFETRQCSGGSGDQEDIPRSEAEEVVIP